MNLYKREIYKKSLQHAERRNHKYLYKIGDRYIYPEDVAGKAKSTASNIGSMATAAGTAAKTKISNTIADQKQKHKDRVFTNTTLPEKLTSKKIGRDDNKELDQIASSHKESTGRKSNSTNVVLDYERRTDGPNIKAKSLDKQKAKTAARKQAARNAKSEAQYKSAHAGYEADKKAFPEGGSTEELELQKKKTADRKKPKELAKKKEKDQIRSAHQQHTIRERRKSMPGPASAPSLETKKKETEYRKYMKAYPKQKYSADQAEYDRRVQSLRNHKELIEEGKYPYTPSLEKQIEKTKKRKKAKYVRSLYNN